METTSRQPTGLAMRTTAAGLVGRRGARPDWLYNLKNRNILVKAAARSMSKPAHVRPEAVRAGQSWLLTPTPAGKRSPSKGGVTPTGDELGFQGG